MNMNDYKVGIVVLNYLTYNDTIECVESALKINYESFVIIIVDNGSNNDSFNILKERFSNEKKIVVLKNEKNLGFARGNNVGIDYARNKLNCDFVFAVNNDTIFTDKDVLRKMIEKYNNKIGLIGPKIIGVDNRNQNPLNKNVSLKKIIKDILESVFYSIIDTKTFHSSSLYNIFIKPFILKKRKERIFYQDKNPVLQGAALMFTPIFFKYYNGFYPDTFLYYEEFILHILLKKVGLISLYVDEAEIYHKESRTSEVSFNNLSKIKSKYRLKSIFECLKVLLFYK